MLQIKNIFRIYKSKIRKLIISTVQSLPISSKYIGPPKSYYLSQEYWNIHKENNLINVVYTPFLPSSVSQRNPPKSVLGKPHWKFDGRHCHTNPETFVISASNCRVVGNMGTVITHDDALLFDVSRQFGIGRNPQYAKLHDIFDSLKLPKCQLIPQTVALLTTAGSNNYFHWLTDALPRLEILKQSLPYGLESIDKFLVNKEIPIMVESLEMLNIPLNKLLFVDSNTHIQAKTLVVPSLPSTPGSPPSWVCSFLRENFLKYKAVIDSSTKLYISRAKSRYRRVTNEESVLECLSKLGFTPVYLEKHNFATQIALLSNAEVIVAPHGAGLSNLIWCNPGARVLEMFSPNYVNICFWAVANQIGLEYFYLIGNGEKPLDYFDPHLVTDDIVVPIEELKLNLELLLE